MQRFCSYVCCCGCFRSSDSYVKRQAKIQKHENLKTLEEVKPESMSDSVWAVTKHPLDVKTSEMTPIYAVPTARFKKDEDVFASIGFKVDTQIDSGSFGVILCGHHIAKKLKIAIKKITIPEPIDSNRAAKREEMLKDVKHELYTLQKVIHPHVVRLITHLMIKGKQNVTLYILMQFAENGNLSKYCDRNGALVESKCLVWFAQMLSALSHMHRQGIAHRDLKLSNILLDTADDVLIADFGLSRLVWRQSQDKMLMSSTFCGTPPYMAPEVLLLETHKYNEYNAFKADVWSLGVILYRMFAGEYPFPNKVSKAIKYMKTRKWKFPKRSQPSSDLKNMLKKIFEPNPKKRPRMEKLQKYDCIRDIFRVVEMKSIQKMKANEETFKQIFD